MKLRTVILLVLAALAIYGIGRREARLSEELQNWKHAAQQALQAGETYHRERDSLIGAENRLSARLQALSGDLRRLGRYADSLEAVADTSVEVGPVRLALGASRASEAVCRATLAVADSGWTTCRTRASLAEARAARLDSLLRVGVKVQSCRLLIFPCPSRGAAFVGGSLVGFLLGRR